SSAALSIRTSQDNFLVEAADGSVTLEYTSSGQEAEGELQAGSRPASTLGAEIGTPRDRTSPVAREVADDVPLKVESGDIAVEGGLGVLSLTTAFQGAVDALEVPAISECVEEQAELVTRACLKPWTWKVRRACF
ncbi:hypothetical protein B0H12DRAFT_1109967, partial [Mycena haematopus]